MMIPNINPAEYAAYQAWDAVKSLSAFPAPIMKEHSAYLQEARRILTETLDAMGKYDGC